MTDKKLKNMNIISLKKITLLYFNDQVKKLKERHVVVINNRSQGVYIFKDIIHSDVDPNLFLINGDTFTITYDTSPVLENIFKLKANDFDDGVFYIGPEYFDEDCDVYLIDF